MPTETVYGLAANALNKDAVLNIFAVKERPSFDPLIVHLDSAEKVDLYATGFCDAAKRLTDALWPGPLTILLPRRDCIPDEVTSGLPHVALRVPEHEVARKLLSTLDFPLAAPSANPFGYISPTCAQHVVNQLGGKIPYVLQGGSSRVGVESTIVGFEGDNVIVMRIGGVSLEQLKSIVGDTGSISVQSSHSDNPAAPGMLKSHYAPSKPLTLLNRNDSIPKSASPDIKIGLISLVHRSDVSVAKQMSLCDGTEVSVDQAARNLFACLREMDAGDCNVIYAEKCPDEGIGRAVNDRLTRAAY